MVVGSDDEDVKMQLFCTRSWGTERMGKGEIFELDIHGGVDVERNCLGGLMVGVCHITVLDQSSRVALWESTLV